MHRGSCIREGAVHIMKSTTITSCNLAYRACRHGPMTYKELMRELPDDITPEDAQKQYQTYLTEWWGSEVRWAMLCSCHLRVGACIP